MESMADRRPSKCRRVLTARYRHHPQRRRGGEAPDGAPLEDRRGLPLEAGAAHIPVRGVRHIPARLRELLGVSATPRDRYRHHLNDICLGRKRYVKNDAVKRAFCPQIEGKWPLVAGRSPRIGLYMRDLLDFISARRDLHDYFPDEEEIPKQGKEWIKNMLRILAEDEFRVSKETQSLLISCNPSCQEGWPMVPVNHPLPFLPCSY